MSDRLKFERFLWFHGRIKADRYPNASHLAKEFEISSRTAQRDIEFIRHRLEAPLEYVSRRRGYRYADTSYELPALWISEDNILALSLAVRLASTIPDRSLKDQLCRLIDRLPLSAGDSPVPCLERLSAKISVKNIEYSQVDRHIFRQSTEALFADRSICITYYSPHTGTTTTRSVHPLHLMHYMGSWHLIAWCANKENLRNFALSRVRTISAAAEISLPEKLPEPKEYTRKNFGIMQGGSATEVVLRFSRQTTPWIHEQIWHQRQVTTVDASGRLTLRFPVGDFRELLKTILGHGAEIEVLHPPELKTLVKEEIKKMRKIYERYDTP